MTTPAVETFGLSKTYQGKTRALVGLDLRVERGEVFGYLGPNGAGKSTTIRLLLDLIHATAGSAAVLGLDSRRQGVEARSRIGYLPGDLRLNDRMTAGEQLDSLARLRGSADDAFRNELCERFGLELERPIRHLSKGNRQKVGLVQAFMHRPELVVLDEPSPGSTRSSRPRCGRSCARLRPTDARSSFRRTRSTRFSTPPTAWRSSAAAV